MKTITRLSLLLTALAAAPTIDVAQEDAPPRQDGQDEQDAQDAQDDGNEADDVDDEDRAEAEDDAPRESAPPAEPTEDALASARNFAKAWPVAVYTMMKGKAETGIYLQKNAMAQVGDETVIEFIDYITMPRMQSEMTFQTHCATDEWFRIRGIAGKLPLGQMKLTIEDGRATGMQIGQTPVDAEVPDHFLIDLSLLRGLPRIPLEPGAEREFDYVDVQNMPGDVIKKGTLRVIGDDVLEIEGQKFPCWKMRWQVEDSRPAFFWYGEDGRMLKKVQQKEKWIFSPSRTAKQDVTAPATRDDEPKKGGKKKGKKQ